MGRIIVVPKAASNGEGVKQFSGKQKPARMEFYRPDSDVPVRLSRVSINFPLLVRLDNASPDEAKTAALDSWYGYCDASQIASMYGQIAHHERTVQSNDPEARRTITGDPILDTGNQTHVFRITWRNLFESVFDWFPADTLQAYTRVGKDKVTQNFKLALCHPHYKTPGTEVAIEALLKAIRSARQADQSVRDLYESTVLATLWVNPTRQNKGDDHDGSSRAFMEDRLIANLVINPDGQKVMPLVVGTAALKVSHDSVNGMREIFIEEFDCRQRQRS